MLEILKEYNPSGFALQIFKDRYSISLEETFQEACRRVANFIASAEDGEKIKQFEERFYEIMSTNRFSPGGRIWRGAGRSKSQMLNCFILEEDSLDSREGWGEIIKDIIIISGTGGGCGISFSKVRPRGTVIRGTGGESTGSVSLMKMINAACEELRAGGSRRSALMFCLDWRHPDLLEFLEVKLDKKQLNNANISVCIDNDFLKLVEEDSEIIFKWQDKEYNRSKARDIWNKIIDNSLLTGDPGILNRGYANQQNNLFYHADLISTNPCAEIWGIENDCCDLGAINLHSHVINGEIDWDLLDETTHLGVRFLDDVLTQNYFPLKKIQEVCHKIRRVGIGVMGTHDMLLELNIKYSSKEALEIIDKTMNFIKKRAYEASIFLSIEKGQFPILDREQFVKSGFCKSSLPKYIRRRILEYGIRNCALLDIAPCGTISIVAGVSSGIEPMFAPVYTRRFNKHLNIQKEEREKSSEIVVHPLLRTFIEKERDYSHFEGAHEILPEQHILMQKICQKHIDNALSKTLNLPKDFKSKELSDLILKNIKDLKGVTIYRDSSKDSSPLEPLPITEAKKYLNKINTKIETVATDCPNNKCEID